MDFSELLVNSLEKYDINNEKNKILYKNFKFLKLKKNNEDNKRNEIIFYDLNKKKIYSSEYEILSVYQKDIKIWAWAWGVDYIEKKSKNISKEIKKYGESLGDIDKLLRNELLTSKFTIVRDIQIDIHLSIASYLSKSNKIYKYYIDKINIDNEDDYIEIKNNKSGNIIYYIVLLNEKYF